MTKRWPIVLTTAGVLLLSVASGHAAFPGANGKIVFAKNGDLWAVGADGRGLARITKTSEPESTPVFSPDGSKLAYVVDGDTVWVARADGSGAVDISAVSLKGTDFEELGSCDSDPTWSPDGKWIAFSTIASDCTGAAGVIYKMTPAGKQRTVVENDYDGLLGGDTEPAWGPGGTRIAITRSDSLRMASGPYVYDLYAVDTKTGKVVRRLTRSNHATTAAWSPDGKRIAFIDGKQIAVMTAAGKEKKVLARGSGPAWSPDGKWIAFVDARGIEVMRPDGSGKRLLYACKECSAPDWQPLRTRTAARSAGDDDSCCVNVITSAKHDADANTVTVNWVSPAKGLCPYAVFVGANSKNLPVWSFVLECSATTATFRLDRLCPCEKMQPPRSFVPAGDFYVMLAFYCRASSSRRDCLGFQPSSSAVLLTSVPFKVKAAAPTTKPPPAKTVTIGKDQSATVRCGSGSGATSVRFVDGQFGTTLSKTIDTRGSVALPIVLGGGTGAPVTWKMTRALVPGWPVSAFGSDYGKLTISGCGATYTAPPNTGDSPRMFVEITITVPAAETPTPPSPGEGGPRTVVPPAKAQITIRGGEVQPASYCGREFLQVAVTRVGPNALAYFYVADGYRVFGPYLASRTFQPIATGWWRVTIFYRDGRNEVVDIRVGPCKFAKVIRG